MVKLFIMTDSLHSETLLDTTRNLINALRRIKPFFLSAFYLSGGSALALQIGHRISEDLDFFTQEQFNGIQYQIELQHIGTLEHLEIDKTSLNCFVKGVKMQLLHYPYKLIENTIDWNGIRLSSVIDIACTKLLTVSQRGSKKDFFDIYFLLKRYSLNELFAKLDEKYSGIQYNKMHILKSLTYFTDADNQPPPRMITNISWDEVKEVILNVVKSISLE